MCLGNTKYSKGLSVVEVMVALAVFSLVSLTTYQVFVQSESISRKKYEEHKAMWLAQEGIEAAYSIGRNNFQELQPGVWGLSKQNGVWSTSIAPDIEDIFLREITVSNIDEDTKEILSEVSWDYKEQTYSVDFSLQITDWQKESQPQGEDLVIDTSGSYIDFDTLRGLSLSSSGEIPILVERIQVYWSKNARVLSEIQSPELVNIFNGPADSGDTVSVSGLVISQNTQKEILFIFNKNMNNTDFVVTFYLSDGSSKTIELLNI